MVTLLNASKHITRGVGARRNGSPPPSLPPPAYNSSLRSSPRCSVLHSPPPVSSPPSPPPPLHAQQPGRGAAAQPLARIPTIEERTATGMQQLDGFFPVYWEERTGNLWLEIPRLDTPVLYATGLAAGLGSNDIGLDRGQEGSGKIVSFERVGPRVLMVQGNENFRSSSANLAERRSVEDSFAKSVLWGFTVAAESDGRVLVDATDFF